MEPTTYGASDVVGDVVSPLTDAAPVIFGAVGGLIALVMVVWFAIKQTKKGANKA